MGVNDEDDLGRGICLEEGFSSGGIVRGRVVGDVGIIETGLRSAVERSFHKHKLWGHGSELVPPAWWVTLTDSSLPA